MVGPSRREKKARVPKETRQVYNLFQEPVEQPPLGFSLAEEKNQTVLKNKQVKKKRKFVKLNVKNERS